MGTLGIQERVVIITAKSFARAVAHAIEQPADVELDEIVVRPNCRDVPKAEVHVLDAGHFALDTKADEIAELVGQFMKAQKCF